MKFLAVRYLNSLRPVDAAGDDALQKISHGKTVRVTVDRPRNIKHMRKFMALMGIVWQQVDHAVHPSVEDLVAEVKVAVGHRVRFVMPNGEVGFIPKSIAFHKMSQQEFDAFYERVCDLIAAYFLPGVTSDELRQEVEIMIGARAP